MKVQLEGAGPLCSWHPGSFCSLSLLCWEPPLGEAQEARILEWPQVNSWPGSECCQQHTGDPGSGAPSAKPGDTCRAAPLRCRCGLGGERHRGPQLRLCPGPEPPSQCLQLLGAEVTGSQHRLCVPHTAGP